MAARRKAPPAPDPAFGALFDAVQDAALCVTRDGVISQANASATLLFGYAPGALPGLRLAHVLPDAQLEPAEEENSGLVRGEGQYRDGSRFELEYRVVPLGDAPGTYAVLAYPRGGEALRVGRRVMTAEVMARAQAIAHLGSWESNFETGRLVWSDETFRIFGHEPGSIEPSLPQFRAQVHPDDMAAVRAAQDEAIERQAPYRCEHRIRRADGSERVVLEQGEVMREGNGTPLGMIGTVLDVTERRQAEQALRDSEARLTLVTNAVPVPISYIGPDLHYRFVNALYERWLGRPVREIVGHSVVELWGPETHRRVQPYLERALGGERMDFEIAQAYPDGEEHTIHGIFVPDFGPDGAVRGISTMVEDVTERRRAEAAVLDSRERLAAVLNLAADAIISVDGQYRVLLFNRGAEEIFGYTAEEAVGQPMEILIPESFRIAHAAHVEAFNRDGPDSKLMNERGDLFGRRKDGSMFPAEASVSRLDVGGARIFTAIVRDVTARKHAEAELRASEERYRLLVEGSLQGTVIHKGRRILFVNPAMARLFGYESPEAMVAMGDLSRLVPARELQRLRHGPAARGKGPGDIVRNLVTALRRDGSTLRVETLSHVAPWQGDLVTQTVAVDVTEREHLEDQLRQSQKMEAVGQLAGGVAHDFNNILQVVRGYAELAEHRAEDAERMGQYMRQILRVTEGGSNLARQLLAFSRRNALNVRPVELNELVVGVMEMLRRLIPETVELHLESAPDLLPVYADPSALEQVLINLCVNARDAMPNGGRLELHTRRVEADERFRAQHGWAEPGRYALVEVADTGTGIPADVLPRIFEPFFTTKELGKGTGLGLSMAYGTLRNHQGMIEVDSRPGEGSTFRVYLPVQAERPPEASEALPPAARGQSEGILVAEDDPAVLRLVTELLEGQGYRVLAATDGEAALHLFETRRDELDVVMLDLVLPKLSGHAVVGRIRLMDPDVPVIFSTGYSSAAVDEDFHRQHGERMIQKPYHPDELFRLIRQVLDEKAARRR